MMIECMDSKILHMVLILAGLQSGQLKDRFPNAEFRIEDEPRDIGAAKDLARNQYQFQ